MIIFTQMSQTGQSPGAGSNRRPRPYQGRALPTELPGPITQRHIEHCALTMHTTIHQPNTTAINENGAGNGTRTRDPKLGRLALYQLSYSRARIREIWWRGKDSNLRRRRRQIYSLLPLATREPLPISLHPTKQIFLNRTQ